MYRVSLSLSLYISPIGSWPSLVCTVLLLACIDHSTSIHPLVWHSFSGTPQLTVTKASSSLQIKHCAHAAKNLQLLAGRATCERYVRDSRFSVTSSQKQYL